MSPPVFAVVGRVNKGKSSIIATLAEDATVEISPRPGTTRRLTRFPVKVDDATQFELVDTPGFEDASRALHWLRAETITADARPARVRALVEAFAGTGDLSDECTLLEPILAGAFVIYVVDGSQPFRANYEDEMEILRWTGRPGMALINRIADDDHAPAWRPALQQYFSVVRDFDAHAATFAQRIGLLRAFRELDAGLAPALDRAVEALVAQRRRRRADVADAMTDLLVDAITLTLEARAAGKDALATVELERRFHEALRDTERRARAKVATLYKHPGQWADDDVGRPVFDADLFAEQVWEGLGLSSGQLLVALTLSGAVAGGTLDAMVGGASWGTGAAIGAAVGAVSGGVHAARRMARATRLRDALRGKGGGKLYRVGPHQNPNFPFVLLDRALLHYDAVLRRTHARRDLATVATPERRAGGHEPSAQGTSERGASAALDRATRAALVSAFAKVRKNFEDPPRQARDAIHAQVRALVEATDHAAGGEIGRG